MQCPARERLWLVVARSRIRNCVLSPRRACGQARSDRGESKSGAARPPRIAGALPNLGPPDSSWPAARPRLAESLCGPEVRGSERRAHIVLAALATADSVRADLDAMCHAPEVGMGLGALV